MAKVEQMTSKFWELLALFWKQQSVQYLDLIERPTPFPVVFGDVELTYILEKPHRALLFHPETSAIHLAGVL